MKVDFLLVGHVRNTGHHLSWTKLTVEALLRSGHSIACITPSSSQLLEILQPFAKSKLNHTLYLIDSPLERLNHQKRPSLMYRLFFALMSPLSLFVYRENSGTLLPGQINNLIDLAYSKGVNTFDSIFFLYLDSISTNPRYWSANRKIAKPWGGIRFAPFSVGAAGKEGYLMDKNFRGFCLLDPSATVLYQRIVPEKYFTCLPDVAFGETYEFTSPDVMEMLGKAGGRKIVLLCGSIEKRKNLKLFSELVAMNLKNEFFFAVIGEIFWADLDNADRESLRAIRDSSNMDTIIIDRYIKSESEFNSFILNSDIIFAVYKEFKLSSNMLSKSALFYKPIIVDRKYLMGANVDRYKIGISVNGDEAELVFDGLESLVHNPPPRSVYLDYQDECGLRQFDSKLNQFMKDALAQNG